MPLGILRLYASRYPGEVRKDRIEAMSHG